jgi:hypothetical protein
VGRGGVSGCAGVANRVRGASEGRRCNGRKVATDTSQGGRTVPLDPPTHPAVLALNAGLGGCDAQKERQGQSCQGSRGVAAHGC